MTIHLSIEYRTQWGEELRVILQDQEYHLSTVDGIVWEGDIDLRTDKSTSKTITYRYALYRDGELVWTEWEVAQHKFLWQDSVKGQRYRMDDRWRPIPADLPLYSSAYTDCIAQHGQPQPESLPTYGRTLQLRIVEPRLGKGEHLAICGNNTQMGNWTRPVRLTLYALQEWALNIDADQIFHPIEYKYVIIDDEDNILQWEDGMNRHIDALNIANGETWIKTDSEPRLEFVRWKCAGVVIPVFSLRSADSYGIGDFGDLKRMILWAASVGMHAVQILPINDTTMDGSWMDSYPYNAISIYAFHPIYCNLKALPRLENKLKEEEFLMKQQELNALTQFDYEAVFALKREYLRLIYQQIGKEVMESQDYKSYFERHKSWLVPYAAFSHLRDTYGTPQFNEWPKYSTYDPRAIATLCSPRSKQYADIAFYYFIQYVLHLQLTEVRDAARAAGVILKGDIPIGISRTSVEAWAEPQFFNLDSQAGAPPDDFSVNGQNWGFPTYNWEAMISDGCSWWMRRFQTMAEYFDAYRIDHILGFFRIWDIPLHSVHGLLGQFSPSLPMSEQEIAERGIDFDTQMMTEPFINDDVLLRVFGYRAELVKTLYLDIDKEKTCRATAFNAFGGVNAFYRMKPEYATQRQVQTAFAHKQSKDDIDMREGLYTLISNVLFIRDRRHEQMYHPRISGRDCDAYKALTEAQRHAFDRLYDDYYYSRHNRFWYDEAMKKLPLLTQCTRMLVCAEDLGMVPQSVVWLMEQLRILTLEIQTMPKAFGIPFGILQDNPYRSVATISTHDMPTMRGWWEEDAERAQRFYNIALGIDGVAPEKLPGWLAAEIVNRHLYSPSLLCLLSLQDWLAMDELLRNPDAASERINIPANPRHYWRWRMHLNIEALEANDSFNESIRTMIGRSGR